MPCEVAEKFTMVLGTGKLRVVASVFIFVPRIRFPVKHSIVNVLLNCYGDNLVKSVRKFEKIDIKFKESIFDLEVLLTCKEKKHTKVYKIQGSPQTSKSSNTYNTCLKRLLNQEISSKRKIIRSIKQNLTSMEDDLDDAMCFIDFVYVTTNLLVSNDKASSEIQKNHDKKLRNMFLTTNFVYRTDF